MALGASVIVAWVDASAGVAGDMLLGALLDAGAELDAVQASVEAVIPGSVRLVTTETMRGGLRATRVGVELVAPDQPHRRWAEIRDRIGAAALPERTRRRALGAFEALARVEADAHGIELEDVHFHEVGAWDSIADVVGACAALEDLGIDEVIVSRIAVGSGSVAAAHGRLPVPVPAVVGLATGWEVDAVGEGELATPTGAALATTLASEQGPVPAMQVIGSGVGAGAKDVVGRANIVRVVLGQRAAAEPVSVAVDPAGLETSTMVVLEANVDDLDPRVWPSVLAALLAAGAADAWLVPIVMKQGRPAHTLCVLAPADHVEVLRDVALDETSTIGVRATSVRRWALPRGRVSVDVAGQAVGVKVAHRDGLVVHATPEHREVVDAATALGRPVRDVLEAAIGATVATGLVRGAAVPSALHS